MALFARKVSKNLAILGEILGSRHLLWGSQRYPSLQRTSPRKPSPASLRRTCYRPHDLGAGLEDAAAGRDAAGGLDGHRDAADELDGQFGRLPELAGWSSQGGQHVPLEALKSTNPEQHARWGGEIMQVPEADVATEFFFGMFATYISSVYVIPSGKNAGQGYHSQSAEVVFNDILNQTRERLKHSTLPQTQVLHAALLLPCLL